MHSELKLRIGLRVREARKKKGLTQSALAEAVEKTFETISNIERGKTAPNFQTLFDIGSVLDVPMREFFDKSDSNAVTSRKRLELLQKVNTQAEALTDKQLERWIKMGALIGEE